MRSFSESYRDAGVNIEAGYEGVKLMKKHVQRTMIPGVVSDIGGFGGLFAPDLSGMKEPVLVSGTDGVGTKQRIAQLMNKHDSVGIDCVAMCVNDIICCGAKPIFFLDYIAIGKNEPEKVATLVSGVAEGCVQSGCALIGGETAEHPGTMAADDYDLAGFAVGIVDREKIVDHDRMKAGDVVIALPSSGIHSNGYSLVRKVFNIEHADLNAYLDELGCTLGDELLRPTKIYVKPVLAGFLSILSENFTKKWPRRILNIHPSLIPSFCGKGMYGLKVHEAALARGVKITGATVHFVNEIPDGGEIILQKAVEIEEGDTPETLQRRVMEQAEWKLLPRATERVCRAITEKEN